MHHLLASPQPLITNRMQRLLGITTIVGIIAGAILGLTLVSSQAGATEGGFKCFNPGQCTTGAYNCEVDCPKAKLCSCTIW
jgi:hypothetical protein